MYDRYEKICSYVLMGIMCISLLILMYLGLYNHPTGDDYYFAVNTKKVFEETGSVWKMLVEAAKGTVYQYQNWQGTYSAMFLMHLPPNAYTENGYRFVTAFILSLYTGGIFYLLKPIMCTILKGTRRMWCTVSAVFVVLTIQTVQFQGDSFFWCNGSMYYTGYFALTLFYFGAMCRYYLNSKKYYIPILWFGALFLAGGNYVSLLPAIIIVVTITVILLMKRSHKAGIIGVAALLMIVGLLVSAVAPGNQVRGQGSLGNIPAYKAIAFSILQSVSYLEAWLNRWWLMSAIVLTPFFWQSYKRIQFTFSKPLVVVGYIHGIFCSMSCPTFYAEGSTGPARVIAIIYYGFMLSTLVNYYYFLGYFHQWWKRRFVAKEEAIDGEQKGFQKMTPHLLATGVFILLLLTQIYSGEMMKCSSVQALQLIQSGDLEVYEQEYQQRLRVLQDDSIKDVVFKPYTRQPAMLYVGDFPGDAEQIYNVQFANYYNKNSIRVDYSEYMEN